MHMVDGSWKIYHIKLKVGGCKVVKLFKGWKAMTALEQWTLQITNKYINMCNMYETNGHEEKTIKYNCIVKKMHKKNGFIDGGVSKNNLQEDRWSFSFSLRVRGER